MLVHLHTTRNAHAIYFWRREPTDPWFVIWKEPKTDSVVSRQTISENAPIIDIVNVNKTHIAVTFGGSSDRLTFWSILNNHLTQLNLPNMMTDYQMVRYTKKHIVGYKNGVIDIISMKNGEVERTLFVNNGQTLLAIDTAPNTIIYQTEEGITIYDIRTTKFSHNKLKMDNCGFATMTKKRIYYAEDGLLKCFNYKKSELVELDHPRHKVISIRRNDKFIVLEADTPVPPTVICNLYDNNGDFRYSVKTNRQMVKMGLGLNLNVDGHNYVWTIRKKDRRSDLYYLHCSKI